MAMVFSPGMFHASAAFLPSSFAMYTTMAGMACFMNWRGGIKTSQGIFWFALGGVLGWPFATALCLPFMVEEVIFAVLAPTDAIGDWVMRIIRGIVAGGLVAVSMFSCLLESLLIISSSQNLSSQASSIRSLYLYHGILFCITSLAEKAKAHRSTAQNLGTSTSRIYSSTLTSGSFSHYYRCQYLLSRNTTARQEMAQLWGECAQSSL